jgi:hypothetical protein
VCVCAVQQTPASQYDRNGRKVTPQQSKSNEAKDGGERLKYSEFARERGFPDIELIDVRRPPRGQVVELTLRAEH